MKHFVKLALGTLALASSAAFAQAPTLPSAATTGGSLTLTLFSTSDGTPFSYSYNLGLTMNQLSMLPTAAGTSQTWTLTGLSTDLAGYGAASSLVYDVSGASASGNAARAAGAIKFASTFDPSVSAATLAALQNQAPENAEAANLTWLTNWSGTANNQFTTNPSASNYANANYGAAEQEFSFNAASSVSNSVSFYELATALGGTSTQIQTPTQFAGLFSINLSNDTLTYTVPGSTSPVPLPAGVWLLLSGLAGMGVFGRRRNDVNGAAA
jgi:hypothetical protein